MAIGTGIVRRGAGAATVLASLLLAAAPERVEITLERREAGAWKSTDPGHVFAQGDQVRFRLRSDTAGYLYVINEGTSGTTTTLFPSAEAGTDNRIEAGREYLIPDNQGAFRLTGPAGFDTVYWIVSPVRLHGETPRYKPLPPPPAAGSGPDNLRPRCDDAIWKARGECVDTSAGLKPNEAPGLRSRELLFLRKEQSSVVAAAGPNPAGPMTYRFRLAHR
jgi:hypothetical protein